MTTATRPGRRSHPSAAARRTGYAIGAAVDAVLWFLVAVEPGWRAVPVLTDAAAGVMRLFTVSLAVGLVANLVYVAYDQPWFKALGDLVTATIGMAVLLALWHVFPFDFGVGGWALAARVMLGLAMVGTAIAMIVHSVSLLRALRDPSGN